ncbi:hypothetical protein [Prosthecobacter sp.]|uniref:hypothetical protein n=1 Tax=Prosthecobacter sp. TaxID=1965333 RepID=UPI003783C8EB
MRTSLFILPLLSTACVTRAEEAPPYAGYQQDLALLRSTRRLPAPVLNASSGEACQAAARLFSKVTFVGLSRERVHAILGDPKTISDYGVAQSPEPDSSLKYRFDTGYGGCEYVIEFRAGVAISLKTNSID